MCTPCSVVPRLEASSCRRLCMHSSSFNLKSCSLLLLAAFALYSLVTLEARDLDLFPAVVNESSAAIRNPKIESWRTKSRRSSNGGKEEEEVEDLRVKVTTPVTLTDLHQLNRVIELETGHCNKLVEVGGSWYCQGFDGNKDVCFDTWATPAFNSCLLYSFGVGHDITFETAMAEAWGCRAFMHDPTVQHDKDFFHVYHTFKPWGVSSRSHVTDEGWKMVTFKEALAANGHMDSQIHYLKIDIEEAEFEILPDMIESGLLENVWQLHMEIHVFRDEDETKWLKRMQASYDIIRRLEDAGFRRVRTTVNNLVKWLDISSGVPGCCSDVLWINENIRTRNLNNLRIINKDR